MIHRMIEILRTEGVESLMEKSLQHVYQNHIRMRLQQIAVDYNGVTVRAGRILDDLIPGMSMNRPQYEYAIVSALNEHVRPSDQVTIIGGGWGVSAVTAGRRGGPGGSITVYEGSAEGVERVRETSALNGVQNQITVEHAIVGIEISLMGDRGDAPVLSGDELSQCDVLVLDCEGAELTILEEMSINPAVIIVETHEYLGAPVSEVETKLRAAGYETRHRSVAEPSQRSFCEENGIYVLVATPTTSPCH